MLDHTTHQSPEVNIPYGYCHCGCGQKTRISPKNDSRSGWVKGEPLSLIRGHQKPTHRSLFDHFWTYCIQKEPDSCWEWAGSKKKQGYGVLSSRGTTLYAHRVSYEIHIGPIPDGMFVCHRCDNPSCVNPTHLFVGTLQDNHRDMMTKGRHNAAHGENASWSKLTDADVKAIRELHAGGTGYRTIAKKYGVGDSTIRDIVKRRNWSHIE